MCHCLSMQNSQRAVGGTARASDHTSHKDQPWMLTLSNCVKPYLTSYRVVSHHQLSCPVFWFPEQVPRAQAQIMWRKWGRTGRPAPPAYFPRGLRGMRLFGGRSLWAEPSIRARAGLPRPPSPQTPSDIVLNMFNATDGARMHMYNGVHNKMNKYNTILNESLGGQHSRDGCQSLSQNTDMLQVRHTLPAVQCFYNAVLHSPGGRRSSHPNAEAVAAVLPLIEAGFPQCLFNHREKARSCQGFPILKQK